MIPKKNWLWNMEFARMIVSYISMGMYKCFGIVIPPDKKHSLKIAVLTLTLFVARSQTYTKNSVLLDGSLQLIKHPSGTFAHSFPWKSCEKGWQSWVLPPFLHFSKPIISVWKIDEQTWQWYWILLSHVSYIYDYTIIYNICMCICIYICIHVYGSAILCERTGIISFFF